MKFFKFKNLLFLLISLFIVGCQQKQSIKEIPLRIEKPLYAKGFYIEYYKNYTKLIVTTPYKGAHKPLEYILPSKSYSKDNLEENQQLIPNIIEKIIATSTTQIPILEAFHLHKKLVGFPNTDFISSPKTRARISQGKIKNIGHNEVINLELLLSIQPSIVFSFAVNEFNNTYTAIKKANIPIVIDASWLEESPLGRAEWIKFYGQILHKPQLANQIFKQIEHNYINALKIKPKTLTQPSIMYGSMYQGIWYTPTGKSYIGQLLKDAQLNYLWKNSTGTGSLSLNFEVVLTKAKNADYWFAPDMVKTKKELLANNPHYAQFKPFNTGKIYTYANTVGAKGGLLFYELGALRPDYILKDFIKITNPDVLPGYRTHFFKPLK